MDTQRSIDSEIVYKNDLSDHVFCARDLLILTLLPAILLCFCQVGSVAAQDQQMTQEEFVQTYTPPKLEAEFSTPRRLPETTEPVPASDPKNEIQLVSGTVASTTSETVGTADPILGNRIARVSNVLREIPKQADQIWREYDITPYTKGRSFPADSKPEQTVIDWILRQTGTRLWHGSPFSILTADEEKLYVYHTKEVQLEIADIVDRFVNPRFFNESYLIRAVSLSRPDWITSGHQYLKPIPILSPGVQGWILEKQGKDLLFQLLGRRNDFKEIAPPQFLIPNGIAHNVASKKQRTYLRDVQANPTALNGYAEDRVTIDEGFGVSFTPLGVLDSQKVDAIIKMDIVQIEKMISLMIDVPTATNPRQRVQIESPQVSSFKLDEQIRWPKDKVLLLDLGTIPLPNQERAAESGSFFSGLTKGMTGSRRSNILLFIEHVPGVTAPTALPATPAVPVSSQTILVNGQTTTQPAATTTQVPTMSTNSSYWNGIR